MSFKSLILVAILSPLLMASCAPVKIQSHYDSFAQFNQLKSYKWSEQALEAGNPKNTEHPAIHRYMRSAVNHQLALNGFNETSNAKADFIVSYRLAKTEQTDTRITTSASLRDDTQVEVVDFNYTEGSVLIEIINPEMNRIIWRGWAKSTISPDVNPSEIYPKIHEAVEGILAKFPPQ